MLSFVLALCTLLICGVNAQVNAGGGMVGPGGVVNYGTGRQQRQARYGVVRDASKGFFIAGSSILHMNGIYERTEGLPRSCEFFILSFL